jgi:hypothetical protein
MAEWFESEPFIDVQTLGVTNLKRGKGSGY